MIRAISIPRTKGMILFLGGHCDAKIPDSPYVIFLLAERNPMIPTISHTMKMAIMISCGNAII